MKQLFFNKQTNEYFLVIKDEFIECFNCKKIIEIGSTIIQKRDFNIFFKKYTKHFYCKNCVPRLSFMGYENYISVILVTEVPEHSIIVPEYKPQLRNTNLNNFEASFYKNHKDCDINNSRCLVSKNPNRNIQITSEEIEKKQFELKQRTKELDTNFKNEKEVSKFLENIRDSQPILPDSNKKLLGDKDAK